MIETGKGKLFLLLSSLYYHFLRLFQDTVRRGETLNLKSNSDNSNWELQTDNGKTRTLPGACFMVPPPDAEALEKVNRYGVQTHSIFFLCDYNRGKACEIMCVCVWSVWTER